MSSNSLKVCSDVHLPTLHVTLSLKTKVSFSQPHCLLDCIQTPWPSTETFYNLFALLLQFLNLVSPRCLHSGYTKRFVLPQIWKVPCLQTYAGPSTWDTHSFSSWWTLSRPSSNVSSSEKAFPNNCSFLPVCPPLASSNNNYSLSYHPLVEIIIRHYIRGCYSVYIF